MPRPLARGPRAGADPTSPPAKREGKWRKVEERFGGPGSKAIEPPAGEDGAGGQEREEVVEHQVAWEGAADAGGSEEPEAKPAEAAGEDETPLLGPGDDLAQLASNDEWAFRKADRLVGRLPGRVGRPTRDTEGEVFDRTTLMVLHKFLTHGTLRSLDFPVATGKEANVFRGTTPGGGYVAVKIFRTNTATFKHVLKYIQGDERFEGVTGDKRALVAAWTQKEFRNLVRMRDVGVDVPEPIKALGNVLVMEYLGTRQGQWPRLKELGRLPDPEGAYRKIAGDYVKAYNEADLIHSDISEYNVLMQDVDTDHPVPRIIDVGQAVLKNHPMAAEFLDRDLKNLTTYFRRQGVDADPQAIRARLQHERHWKKDEEADGAGGEGEP